VNLLRPTLCLLLSALTCAAEVKEARTAKERAIHAVAGKFAAPGYATLAAKCRLLADAAEALADAPDAARLEKSRACWLAAAIAARELECFKIGPVADGSDASLFYFGAVRPASIERAVANPPADLHDLGAAAKGLHGIEYLLFPADRDDAAVLAGLSGESGKNRRNYLSLISRELADRSAHLAKSWQEPRAASALRFINGGQESLNTLVNQIAALSETIAVDRLEARITPPDGAKHDENPRAWQLLHASVNGIHKVHLGGLGDYTRHLNAPLADLLDRRFASSLESLAALRQPGQDPQAQALMDAAREGFELNVLLRNDLPSTLGVTLTFISTDGD
jgi:predicted lipoprotein